METVTPVEVVIKPGEVTTTGPAMVVLVKSTETDKNFFFMKHSHEDWLAKVMRACDDPDATRRRVKVQLKELKGFGGYHGTDDLQSV